MIVFQYSLRLYISNAIPRIYINCYLYSLLSTSHNLAMALIIWPPSYIYSSLLFYLLSIVFCSNYIRWRCILAYRIHYAYQIFYVIMLIVMFMHMPTCMLPYSVYRISQSSKPILTNLFATLIVYLLNNYTNKDKVGSTNVPVFRFYSKSI